MSLEATKGVSTCAEPVSLDRARMKRVADDFVVLLRGEFSPEARLWLATFRPDALRCLDDAEQALEAEWRQGDRKSFTVALRFCSAMYLAVFSIYEKRQRWLTYSGTLDSGACSDIPAR